MLKVQNKLVKIYDKRFTTVVVVNNNIMHVLNCSESQAKTLTSTKNMATVFALAIMVAQ